MNPERSTLPVWCPRFSLILFIVLTIALSGLFMPGCSWLMEFDLSGVVKNCRTGEPVDGVVVSLKAVATKRASFYTTPSTEPRLPILTGKDGNFCVRIIELEQQIIECAPRWSVELSKSGFASKSVDITPDAASLSSSEGRICIWVCLRPAAEADPDEEGGHPALVRPEADTGSQVRME